MAFTDKEAEKAYKHSWYMGNRARLGKTDRVILTPEQGNRTPRLT